MSPGETRTADSTKLFYGEAMNRAFIEEMQRDDAVVLFGQDIADYGGLYRETRGLLELFGPDRVRNTPVAEAATVGLAVGAAAMGLRPVVIISYMDFIMLALEPLVNYAARLKHKTAGQLTAPLVVRATMGAREHGKGQGPTHSQCLESWMMSVPGIRVVAPATAQDAYSMLKAAIRDDGPVVYLDHKRLFSTAGLVHFGDRGDLDTAAVVRRGTDVTIVCHSFMCHVVERAASAMERDMVSCEIVDLRSLNPLDTETVVGSARKTGALLLVEEGQQTCGVGAEVGFRVGEQLPSVPIKRLAALPCPVSSNPIMKSICIPNEERVTAALKELLAAKQARRALPETPSSRLDPR